MTFPIFGSECAPDVFDARPTVEPGTTQNNAAAIDLVRLFGLDRVPSGRRLVRRWHREVDGRLACHWKPDIVPIPQR
jgi:hypothetical protein